MTTGADAIRGFYAILHAADEDLARRLVTPTAAGGAGARILQVRIKPSGQAHQPVRETLEAGRMARRVTREHGALLVIDDRLDIALAVDADGVHLGQDDLPLPDARLALERAGSSRRLIIGVSTHNRAQVRRALDQGADYLGFGPVFATHTKDNPDPVQGVAGLRDAVALAGAVPVVAIGGISRDNIDQVVAAGAAAACAIGAINLAADPGVAGASLTHAFGADRPAG